MIFQQFYLKSLGHASYFIGSEQSGEALVLDVRRDVDVYLHEARDRGMRLRFAVDTHQHNDYLSGICELPERGEIQLLAGARAQLGYPVQHLGDGQRLEMGEVVFEILDTPGHTPEHISLLVTDRSRGDEPALLLSGGALLVADVARPDLLGGPEEAGRHARELCRTLSGRILTLPDHVEVFPTHVAGSLCGGNIGSRLSTTIGYERRLNRLLVGLDAGDPDAGLCLDLRNLPGIPPYWRRMRHLNQQGPPLLGSLSDPPALAVKDFDKLLRKGALVLDCRSPEAFALHIPGALNVGLGNSFSTWAGTVLPADAPYLLVLDTGQDLWEACWQLLRIGYNLPDGWLAGGMFAWRSAAMELARMEQLTVWDLAREREGKTDLVILDVRQPREWAGGHIAGAIFITGAELPERLTEVPKNRPVAVICGSGYRSTVAASLLKSRDYRRTATVMGGMNAWVKAGLPTVSE
ncbi:MAG: MBL fold metallo-hydrolase [Thermodesulfobacteriota bacterium]